MLSVRFRQSLYSACTTGCIEGGWLFVPVCTAVLVLSEGLWCGGCMALQADCSFLLPTRSAHQHLCQILLPETPESSHHRRQKGERLPLLQDL